MSNTTNETVLPEGWRGQAFLDLSIKDAIAFLQSTGSQEQSVNAVICDNSYGADTVLERYKQMLTAYLINKKNAHGQPL